MINRGHLRFLAKNLALIGLLLMGGVPLLAQDYVKYTSLEDALADPESVEYLKLRRNGYDEWPAELASFPNLKVLDLAHNKLKAIPYGLSYAEKLEELILTGNELDSLQSSIAQFTGLRKLLVGNNYIYHVSAQIEQLEQLEFFEIWSNETHYLPKEVGNLQALKEVDMRGIQISERHQDNIRSLFDESVTVKLSLSCNCD